MNHDEVIAWVESPLQLIGAVEWAHRAGRAVPVAGRLTPQMGSTADELIARGAPLSDCTPFAGIPWGLLSTHRHWLVGDGFSGQFRLAATVLRPQRVTFLDDGANIVPLIDTLLGDRDYARPDVEERWSSTLVAPFAHERVSQLASRGGVDVFTAFDFGLARCIRLRDRGVRVAEHGFEWTRATAPGATLPTRRVILGSARPADGRMPLGEYLDWVSRIAAHGRATYLPHRRESRAMLDAVEGIAGVDVQDTGLPVELVLAGTPHPLELFTQPSSTITTLRHVLEGTGSVIREGARPASRPRRAAVGGA